MNTADRQLMPEYIFPQPFKMLILNFKTASSEDVLMCAAAQFVVAGHLSPSDELHSQIVETPR
jgi:hypothetical protein